MTAERCRLLDDYLAGEVEQGERVAFEAHLVACAACEAEVRAFSLLKTSLRKAMQGLEETPANLAERIEVEAVRRRRRRLGVRVAAVAATLLLGFVIGWRLLVPAGPGAAVEVVQPTPTSPPPSLSGSAPEVAVYVRSDQPVIALPMKTERPNVTIYWIYPKAGAPVLASDEDSPEPSLERN